MALERSNQATGESHPLWGKGGGFSGRWEGGGGGDGGGGGRGGGAAPQVATSRWNIKWSTRGWPGGRLRSPSAAGGWRRSCWLLHGGEGAKAHLKFELRQIGIFINSSC